ncbi:hypothetical protein GHT06_011422 [Daphnia sinensis]|uniref:Uncharacterized protein n=1 Tax=Daphnia sinensis TaxID=1820382 RepID=A0AAD5PYY3_9CRUS|nr:hypothetical protein GHT06_011422 [Daphnia sinensis]
MKGIFNSNPPKPKYAGTWDVDLVLNFFKSAPPNKDLSLIQLSRKAAMLLALVKMFRVSELAAIDSTSLKTAENRTASLSEDKPLSRHQDMSGRNNGRLLEGNTPLTLFIFSFPIFFSSPSSTYL